MKNKTRIALIISALIITFGVPAQSSVTGTVGANVTVCVDWVTKELKYSKHWSKCPPRTTALNLGTQGQQTGTQETRGLSAYEIAQKNGFQGTESAWLLSLRGPQGFSGSSGPAGRAGSGFTLSDNPVLNILNNAISSSPDCETRWSRIINLLAVNGDYNIVYDELGQALRNEQWALDQAEGCPYIFPEIFENPNISSISDIVVGTATNSENSIQASYRPATNWKATVTSFEVSFVLDSGWSLCTAADPAYLDFNMSQDSYWTQLSGNAWRFDGSADLEFFGPQPDDDATGYFDLIVNFCSLSTETASGFEIKKFSFHSGAGRDGGDSIRFPVLWSQVRPVG